MHIISIQIQHQMNSKSSACKWLLPWQKKYIVFRLIFLAFLFFFSLRLRSFALSYIFHRSSFLCVIYRFNYMFTQFTSNKSHTKNIAAYVCYHYEEIFFWCVRMFVYLLVGWFIGLFVYSIIRSSDQIAGHLISQNGHIPMFRIEKTIFPVHWVHM